MSKLKIYIAGPISGIINHNEFEFNTAEKMWKARGAEKVFNPTQTNPSLLVSKGKITGDQAYRECMRVDLEWILAHANSMYMLKGWERSPGATAEHALAVCLKLDIYYE